MIISYLRLVIILGIQQQVLSRTANVHQRLSALRYKLQKERQAFPLRSRTEAPDFVDLNYDLIVSRPSEMAMMKPGLRLGGRHRHRHRKHRSRKDANITTKIPNNLSTTELTTIATIAESIPETATPNNIASETNIKELKQKEEAVIGRAPREALEKKIDELKETIEMAIVNAPSRTFQTNVRQLEDKVKTAIKSLNKFLDKSNTKSGTENETSVSWPMDKRVGIKISKRYLNETEDNKAEENFATTSQNPRKANSKVSHAVPFYRRLNYLHEKERNKPQKWVHCVDLITPRLQGINEHEWPPKEVNRMHPDVKNLAHLFYIDVKKFSQEDILSILLQISKIRIRMYQWDYTAITMIFNVIIKGPVHSFKTLKLGIKELFAKWHLDTSDSMLPIFLEQTRIFRPPCIDISGRSGFTKKPGGIAMFTKPHKPTIYHDPDVSCKSREQKYNNDP